ncbi:MAG: FAD binding domain-containing protein, partial [Chloroflexota bacterium]|nr:FAD binding domain-containing protein [Chloroflexota bacterium]
DAVRLLAERGSDAMLVAGGTDLFPNMKRRQFEPKYLVGLSGLRELCGIRNESGNIVIGASTTLTQISQSPNLQSLSTAASLVSSPQLRNAGTIGGNLCLDTRCNYYDQTYFWRKAIGFCMKKDGDICLVAPGGSRCWAISSTDCAPVAVALDARVRLVGPSGAREIPASALYRDDGMEYLTKAPNEILTEIILPPADGLRSTYLKLRRRGSIDFPLLGVAAALRVAPSGIVEHARIVLGAIASQPVEATDAERILIGQKLTPDVIDAAAEAAYKPAKPMDNADASYAWRKKMVRVYVARALEELSRQ